MTSYDPRSRIHELGINQADWNDLSQTAADTGFFRGQRQPWNITIYNCPDLSESLRLGHLSRAAGEMWAEFINMPPDLSTDLVLENFTSRSIPKISARLHEFGARLGYQSQQGKMFLDAATTFARYEGMLRSELFFAGGTESIPGSFRSIFGALRELGGCPPETHHVSGKIVLTPVWRDTSHSAAQRGNPIRLGVVPYGD